MARGTAVPTLPGESGTGMARAPRQGQRRSEIPGLQRALGTRQAHEPRYAHTGLGIAGAARAAGPRHKRLGVLLLPYLLDDELRRLPSADRSQLEEPQPSL